MRCNSSDSLKSRQTMGYPMQTNRRGAGTTGRRPDRRHSGGCAELRAAALVRPITHKEIAGMHSKGE